MGPGNCGGWECGASDDSSCPAGGGSSGLVGEDTVHVAAVDAVINVHKTVRWREEVKKMRSEWAKKTL